LNCYIKENFDKIYQQLSAALKKCVDIAREKGASSWLSAIPIQKHGYALHKRAFCDAIAFRYGWRPPHLPTTCACGKPFSIDHSLNCSFGGFPTIQHNELRDVTANLLSQVCSNVQIKLHLQPLSGETLAHRTSNVDNQARLDISAKGFWNTSHELAFLMLEFLILWQRVISTSHFPLVTENMKMRISVSMRKGSVMLNMEPSLHLFFQL